MKKHFTAILLIVISWSVSAQDFPYGSHTSAELEMKRYNKDTSAHAVVLKEYGKAYINSNVANELSFEYHVKIKIFDKQAFDQGNVEINVRKVYDDTTETAKDIKATTYYIDEKGVEHSSNLDVDKIYRERNGSRETVKFALPDLHNGCIIEYRYKVISNHIYNFHSWVFQSDIPKVYSEYEANIPGMFEYNVSLRGNLKMSKDTSQLIRNCFTMPGLLADCTRLNYVMKDIPAFVYEDQMLAPSNYISALHFELANYTTPEGQKKKLSQDWKDIEASLLKEESFGGQMKKKAVVKDRLPAEILAIADTLTKAQAIYAYLQKLFKFDGVYTIYSDDGIKKAFEKHSANSADINLALIAGLNSAGINTQAVILPTISKGVAGDYPNLTDFNYVIAITVIGNKVYLLDATDPLLSFGLLPPRCINYRGRVINMDKSSYWIPLIATEKNKTITTLDLTLAADRKTTGTIRTYLFGYAAYDRRKQIKDFNSIPEYIESLNERSPKLKIIRSEINNLDSLNEPLIENFEVEFKKISASDNTAIEFTPSFWSQVTQNPYKLDKRNYPVNIITNHDHKMILTMRYPESFEIINQPAPVGMALPNNGGNFATSFQANNGILGYSEVVKLDKPIYTVEEYPYLKELYNKIIQNQKANIVFKKKQ